MEAMDNAYGISARFDALHQQDLPLLLPNAWDAGSARMLQAAGAKAIGTTSAGQAFSTAQTDGTAGRGAVLSNAAKIAAAVSIPVTADLLNGLADTPDGVAQTIRTAIDIGLAGASIEDTTGLSDMPLFAFADAVARIAAARAAIDESGKPFVLTARADALFAGMVFPRFSPDFEDVIRRLRAFAQAGANVVYAPGLTAPADIKRVVNAVDIPVNVLVGLPGMTLSTEDYGRLGVKRLSLGSGLFSDAYGAAQCSFRGWQETGVYTPSATALDYGQATALMGQPTNQ